ncbi:hypothetical protein L249_2806 [Ophiocordyceps polyrhachis-furcata BCC 54312]|uniref:Peroxisomal biogenesis factor 11 n=1 Tax=Ophiocordyceps polyrhachis-furcata BCC 54312 TaxID=1330021 RepID=A0A367LP87_9HYPO|nr:hypothetical protein L249_2806 [Ophiocordyceps polyrhachis-furcata BCC 54312]
MVADALVYHPSLAHYLRFAATTLGRDKLLRTVQYFARFYAWYLLRTNALQSNIDPWAALKRQLGLTRRILRLGKPLEHLQAAALAFDQQRRRKSGSSNSNNKDNDNNNNSEKNTTTTTSNIKSVDSCFRTYVAVARQLSYAVYLSLDALALPDALGLVKSPRAPAIQRQAYRFWAFGIIFSIAAQLYSLRQLRRREAAIDRRDGEGVVESKRIAFERSASRIQLLCDLCDLTIPTSALGWLSFDDGFVGLAGACSSLIGIHSQWSKTA